MSDHKTHQRLAEIRALAIDLMIQLERDEDCSELKVSACFNSILQIVIDEVTSKNPRL